MNTTTNPFAPPEAHVSDIAQYPAMYQPVHVFSIKGRMGRLRYLAYATGSSFVLMFISALTARFGLPWLGGIVLLGILVLNVMFLIQRSHDMDLSGWMSIVALIPIVGLFWLFKGGTPGPNRFGSPPPPNTLGVKILGCAVPVIFVIGIVAAIALPAYQQYVLRAQSVPR